MTVLTDTGILLRLSDPNDPQHAAVDLAVNALLGQGDAVAMAAQIAAEFWNVCTRPKSARGGWGLHLAEADRRLRVIEAGFPVLPELPGVYAEWRRLVVAHQVQGRQVHDARLAALMAAHGITHILTLNAADFARYPGITAVVPLTPPR